MLLNTVILVLQETLEAALLISVLLNIGRLQSRNTLWLPASLALGVLLAVLYATQMSAISIWFEYQGQELVNAFLQIMIALLIAVCSWAISYNRDGRGWAPDIGSKAATFIICAILAVALAIAREGTEILLYLGGSFQKNKLFHTISAGSLIGFGIGISIGILLYYSLQALSQKWRIRSTLLLLALFAGNMLSQAMLLLTQADWLTDIGALWDSSNWLAENSISGQLLYALVGYEATPSLSQILAYSGGLLMILVFVYVGGRQGSRNSGLVG